MKLSELQDFCNRMSGQHIGPHVDPEVTIIVGVYGIGATPTMAVQSVVAGTGGDYGKILITPVSPLVPKKPDSKAKGKKRGR